VEQRVRYTAPPSGSAAQVAESLRGALSKGRVEAAGDNAHARKK